MTAPTGRQIELRLGDRHAVVTETGGTLRSFRVGGRDVVVPFAVDELPPAVHGAVLIPWPNRIGDGRYSFDGKEYQLDLSEPERSNAIHGLVRHTRWSVSEQSDTSVRLELDLVPRLGYPFSLRFSLDYDLSPDALRVTLTATNIGDRTAPYGAGFHPWLSPGAHRLEDCALSIDATSWVEVDDRLLPVTESPDLPVEKDFRAARRIGATRLDDGFGATGERSAVRLTDPDGVTATVWQEEGFACWQVFTGDGLPGQWLRSGLAAEPMTCAADAFRTGERLIRLAPGATHTCRFGLGLA